MNEPKDPIESVLRSLSKGSWTPGDHEQKLEDVLMRNYEPAGRAPRLGRSRAVWIGGLVLLAGGAGFAATGGREAVKKLLVQVQLIGSDGSMFEGELTPIAGSGDYQMQVALDDGRQAELQVRVVEDMQGDEGMKQVMVQIPEGGAAAMAGNGTTKEVRVSLGDDAATQGVAAPMAMIAPHAQPIVVEEIGEPEQTLQWSDDEGVSHTLHLVRNAEGDAAGAGFKLYREQEDETYLQIGEVRTPAGRPMTVEEIDIDDEGYVSLSLQSPEGKQMTISVFGGLREPAAIETAQPAEAGRVILRRLDSKE